MSTLCWWWIYGGYGGVGDNDVGNGVIGVKNAPLRPGVHQLNFTLIAGVGEGAAVFGRLQVFSPSFSSSSVALIKMPLCLEYTILAAVTPFFCQTWTKNLLFFPPYINPTQLFSLTTPPKLRLFSRRCPVWLVTTGLNTFATTIEIEDLSRKTCTTICFLGREVGALFLQTDLASSQFRGA